MEYRADANRYDTMPYRRCGKSGLKLPRVSLGLWNNFGSVCVYENMRAMCRTAFDHGVTHFDLANNYGPVPGSAEENFGRILRDDFSSYRDELIISTKAGYRMWPGPYGDFGSRKSLLSSLDQSLQRMGLEYVDIFYHHRMDPETPVEESMGALAQAVHSGKALYAGISNYNAATARKAIAILEDLRCPYVLDQVRYSILDRWIEPDGLLDAARETGLGLIAFSPLAQGQLTNRYLNGIPADSRAGRGVIFLPQEKVKANLPKVRALNEIAAARGQALAQMALSWVLRQDVVTSVLIGASSPEQILENIGVIGNAPDFTEEELAEIDRLCPA